MNPPTVCALLSFIAPFVVASLIVLAVILGVIVGAFKILSID